MLVIVIANRLEKWFLSPPLHRTPTLPPSAFFCSPMSDNKPLRTPPLRQFISLLNPDLSARRRWVRLLLRRPCALRSPCRRFAPGEGAHGRRRICSVLVRPYPLPPGQAFPHRLETRQRCAPVPSQDRIVMSLRGRGFDLYLWGLILTNHSTEWTTS